MCVMLHAAIGYLRNGKLEPFRIYFYDLNIYTIYPSWRGIKCLHMAQAHYTQKYDDSVVVPRHAAFFGVSKCKWGCKSWEQKANK